VRAYLSGAIWTAISGNVQDVAVSVAELTANLVAIDSVNPSLVPGGAGEAEVAVFIADWARGQGLEARVVEATTGRPSVLVTARGSGGVGRSSSAVTSTRSVSKGWRSRTGRDVRAIGCTGAVATT
jgi:hypothetical protein